MPPQAPNIIFIMADDHAAKAISAYGHGINHTPNLDRIAKDGMIMHHCYVSNSICTPSRATILTGMHNHVNLVHTLACKINNRFPNAAKHLRNFGNYHTGMVGKWHLGEGKDHEPTGFDYWDVFDGQGEYFDPTFITKDGTYGLEGYATDIVTDKSIEFIERRDTSKPFFLMSHHKAPHAGWEYDPKHQDLYTEPIRVPETYEDDYKNRAGAAEAARIRVAVDLAYYDLGLVQPEGKAGKVGKRRPWGAAATGNSQNRLVPHKVEGMQQPLRDIRTGEEFWFKTDRELALFKYQRYMQRYLRTVQSVDDNVGRLLDYLDAKGLSDNTFVMYTSDQGFFLGDHGWYDKRFMYEESFQMPFLVRGPGIKAGSVCNDIVSNVDFAPTWLDFAGLAKPPYMQGDSFKPNLQATMEKPQHEDTVAYHRYWMHKDLNTWTYAHYGIRDKRWKLIFWYNQDLGIPGALPGGEEQEWELFDCDKDPMELFNLWNQDEQELVPVRERMLRLLEAKMESIGDEPAHPFGLGGEEMRSRYVAGARIAAKAEEHNM